jgi:3'-phosphoadenosine 5'-phosphosulfate sulfotransferase (PAPS reductase)/FAD synthetase
VTDALFDEADLYEGDPLAPDIETPTPPDVVARLTAADRVRRTTWLIEQAHAIHEAGIATHLDGRDLVAECVLVSGGTDSTDLSHLFKHRDTHFVHANTTFGIEETRQYVRDLAVAWSIPLIEEYPPDDYESLVLGDVLTRAGEQVWEPGFPGPGAHGFIYARLKERGLDKARHTLGVANSRTKAVVYIAGRRRQESKRREDVPLFQSDGTVIWTSPLAMWTKSDMNTYRIMRRDDDPVPVNPVSEKLHMSGECLCGAYAHPGELEEIRFWYPEMAAQIDALMAKARARGIPEPWCTWGHGQGKPKPGPAPRLCQSCDDRFQSMLFEASQ